MSSLFSLAWRSVLQHRLRSLLSLLAVALGVAMTLAADVISRSVMAIMTRVEDVRTIGAGLFGQMDTFMSFVGIGVAVAAGFMAFNAFLMSVTQRRRQIGMLRSLGMTRGQVLQLMLAEALLIGGGGTLAGLAGGYPLAWGLQALLKAFGGPMFSASSRAAASAGMAALAAGLGLGSSLLAMLIPAWQAVRISPLEALRESTPAPPPKAGWRAGQVRALAGAGLCAALLLYLILAPPGRWVTFPLDLILTALAALLWLAGLGLMLPEFIGLMGAIGQRPLQRWFGAAGRLMADNLARPAARARATLTTLTLAVGLTLIVSLTGALTFLFDELFGPAFHRAAGQQMYTVATFDPMEGVAAYTDMTSLRIPLAATLELREAVGGLGRVMDWNFVVAPEIAFIPSYFSFMIDPEDLEATQNWIFKFSEGSWDQALPIMRAGCGLLVSPLVARANGVGLYDHLTITSKRGSLDCVIAGIGQPFVNATIISGWAFDITDPFTLVIQPAEGVSEEEIVATAQPVIRRHRLVLQAVGDITDLIFKTMDQLNGIFDALLLLAILAAALGVVNTTFISIAERQRELGLLRAVGATRRQVAAVVVGEAALLGLAGGMLGLATGVGITVILATVYGGNAWGVDMEVWAAAGRAARPALSVGLFGLVAAPLVCAVAAWWPARSLLRGPALQTLSPESQAASSGSPEPAARPGMSHLSFLVLRNLAEARTRTILSALAVALGVAIVVATSVFISGTRAGWEGGENKMEFIVEFSFLAFYAVGALLTVAAGFLIYNAFAMSVAQRQRQIGLQRSLGMTRRQVLSQVLWEALLTGGAGTLAGVVVGPLLGNVILAVLEQMGMQAGRGQVSVATVLLAIAMGLGITLISALGPARTAACLTPMSALRDSGPSPHHRARRQQLRVAVGAALLAGLLLYLLVAPPGKWTGYHEPWNWIISFGLWGVWLTGLYLVTPALLPVAVRVARSGLARLGGNVGRLAGDNLARSPERVTVMTLTFAVGLMMLVGAGGEIGFTNGVLVVQVAETILHQSSWRLTPFDPTTGVGQLNAYTMNAPGLEDGIVAEVKRLAAGRAVVSEVHLVVAPEISAPMPGFPSVILSDPDPLARPGNFNLVEGEWDAILPMLRTDECAAIVSPAVAARVGAGAGSMISVTGPNGAVMVRVAGLGMGGVPPLAVMGAGCKGAYVKEGKNPDALIVRPEPGVDAAALETELYTLKNRYPGKAYVSRPDDELRAVLDTADQLMFVLNGMVMLGIVGAALGMVNATLMSVLERRRELGLLRAAGATRRQVTLIVMAEAAMVGLLGALLGTLAGIGMGAIFALAYGGVTFGLVDLPLWWAAGQTVWPALLNGWPGIVAAPLLAGLAAYPAARLALRGSAVETLVPESQPRLPSHHAVAGVFSRSNPRVRFTVGAAALLGLVLAGLISAVLAHAQARQDEITADALQRMTGLTAHLLELALPPKIQALDFRQLQNRIGFNADINHLRRFRALMEDRAETGVEEFIVTDQYDAVLISLDIEEIGDTVPPLEDFDKAVAGERDGRPVLRAAAPVHNQAGAVVGSVRLAVNTRETQGFLSRLGTTLAALGAGTILIEVLACLVFSGSLAAAGKAAAQRADQGWFRTPSVRNLWGRLSLRTRLTLALVLASAGLIVALEAVVVPIEQAYLESALQNTLLARTRWIGQLASEGLDAGWNGPPSNEGSALESLARFSQAEDLERWQALAEEVRDADFAYVALLNRDRRVTLSDQLVLMGESLPVADSTRLETSVWRDRRVWVLSTPLRRGQNGELLGAFRFALRLDAVDRFVDESRNLLRLAGVITVLASALLAQAIAAAVAGKRAVGA